MKPLLCSILLMLLFANSAISQTPPERRRAGSNNTNSSGPSESLSVQEYREILQQERKLLDEQSERYYARIDKLIDRTIWAMGIIGGLAITVLGGLIGWGFGRTRKELQAMVQKQLEGPVRERFEKQVSTIMESEVTPLISTVQVLKTQIDELQAFQNQTVIWFFSGDKVTAEEEIQVLHSMGLGKIEISAPTELTQIELEEADLVIFSYDGTDEGRNRLGKIVAVLKQQSQRIFLLIYTYNSAGAENRIEEAETAILGDFRWYLPANFPASLISQAQLLIRKKRT